MLRSKIHKSEDSGEDDAALLREPVHILLVPIFCGDAAASQVQGREGNHAPAIDCLANECHAYEVYHLKDVVRANEETEEAAVGYHVLLLTILAKVGEYPVMVEVAS